VRTAQEHLNRLGFSVGRADGNFGARSRAALRDFKRRYGLPDNELIDQATLDALAR
jgi:N-acetylmuramoyl-L-alanine amidase